jgi:hypothetical protein
LGKGTIKDGLGVQEVEGTKVRGARNTGRGKDGGHMGRKVKSGESSNSKNTQQESLKLERGKEVVAVGGIVANGVIGGGGTKSSKSGGV